MKRLFITLDGRSLGSIDIEHTGTISFTAHAQGDRVARIKPIDDTLFSLDFVPVEPNTNKCFVCDATEDLKMKTFTVFGRDFTEWSCKECFELEEDKVGNWED